MSPSPGARCSCTPARHVLDGDRAEVRRERAHGGVGLHRAGDEAVAGVERQRRGPGPPRRDGPSRRSRRRASRARARPRRSRRAPWPYATTGAHAVDEPRPSSAAVVPGSGTPAQNDTASLPSVGRDVDAGRRNVQPARAVLASASTSVGWCLRARVEQEPGTGLDDAAEPQRVEAAAQRGGPAGRGRGRTGRGGRRRGSARRRRSRSRRAAPARRRGGGWSGRWCCRRSAGHATPVGSLSSDHLRHDVPARLAVQRVQRADAPARPVAGRTTPGPPSRSSASAVRCTRPQPPGSRADGDERVVAVAQPLHAALADPPVRHRLHLAAGHQHLHRRRRRRRDGRTCTSTSKPRVVQAADARARAGRRRSRSAGRSAARSTRRASTVPRSRSHERGRAQRRPVEHRLQRPVLGDQPLRRVPGEPAVQVAGGVARRARRRAGRA